MSALDVVDITSALMADPMATAKLANSLADWTNNSVRDFAQAQARFAAFVSTGQLGIFGSGNWDHPPMILPPEANLMDATHSLQALDHQRRMNKVVAILGSKIPHIQNMAVGGVPNPINLGNQSTLTLEKLMHVGSLINEVGSFIHDVDRPDMAAIGAPHAGWTAYGRGVVNDLSIPDMPIDTKGTQFALRSGYLDNGDLTNGFTSREGLPRSAFREGREGERQTVLESGRQGATAPL